MPYHAGRSNGVRLGDSCARFKNGDERLPSPSRYPKIKGEALSERVLRNEEKQMEEMDYPISLSLDGPGVIRRLVAEYGGQIVESATVSCTTLRKTLGDVVKLTLASVMAVQNVLLEQMDYLQRTGCFSLDLLHRQHGRSIRLQLSAESMGILPQLSDHVRALGSSPGEKSVVLDRVREVHLAVDLILSHLLDPLKDNANISGLLSEFNHSALKYLSDQYVGNLSLFLYVDELPDLNPSLEPCPLEEAFNNFLSTTNSSTHSLIAFTAWAQMENMDSEISQNIGPVTGASLYQVSRGLIRHEFAIITFHNGKAPTSWLRTERIPRFKNGCLNSDGLGLAFSGVEACDIVSFSASKSALIGNDVVRVAEVSIAMDPTVLRMGVYLNELAGNLVSLSGHYPKYPLLASNCRYFPRLMVLNFAQRLAKIPSLRTQMSIKLGHKDRGSYRILADKLRDEPLRESQLVGEKGVLSKAERILGRAQRHSTLSRDADALQLCDEAVEVLESMPKSDIASRILMGRCYILKCETLRQLHRFDDSFAAGQAACDILRTGVGDDVASQVVDADCLARALHQCSHPALKLGFKDDAIRHSRESVRIRRLLLVLEPQNPYHLYHLGFALGSLSLALSETAEMTEAVESGHEGVQIFRTLYSQQPGIFGDGLAGMLHNYSLVLAKAKRTEEAHTATAEVVKLRRKVNAIPERHQHLLALALHSYAAHAAALERWEESIAADKESLELYLSLQARRPVAFDADVIRGWESYARHLKSGNRLEEAFACRREHVQAVQSLFDKVPTLHRRDLALALRHYAHYASDCEHLGESIQAAKESLQHYQMLAEDDPKYEADVVSGFTMLSSYLSKSGLMEESIRYRRQEIVVLRRAFAKDSDSWRNNLASALYNLGSDLAESDRWAEAVVEEEEALQHYLVLAEIDPGEFKSDMADTHGLLSLHFPLAGNLDAGIGHGRQQIEILRSSVTTTLDSHQENLAFALSKHATNLNAAKAWEEVIAVASESLELYRHFAETKPEERTSHVISAIHLLADHLSDAGQFQEALNTRNEHVAMLRSAAAQDPGTHKAYLAWALSRLADDLHTVEQWEEATEADNESLALYRSLAKDDPGKYEPDIADGLNVLADHLMSSGQHEKGFNIRREYVSMLRLSTSQNPGSQKEVLAFALNGLASDAAGAKLWGEAIEAAKESLTIYRSLAQDKPEKYESNIADVLNDLAIDLSSGEQFKEAYDIQKEYVAILRAAVAKDSEKHQPSLSRAVYDLGAIAAKLELWDEACETDNEALQMFRSLEKVDPDEYTEALMDTLHNYASHLQSSERIEEAMPYFREQLTIARALFAKDPSSNRSKLAGVLYDNAYEAEDLELWNESIPADKESLGLYRILAEENPDKFMPDVIHGLDILARHLECADRREEALIYRREQVSNIRISLDNEKNSYWNPAELAEALLHLGLDATDSQLLDESIKAHQESLRIYQNLAKDDFETYCAEIIEGLCSLAKHFFSLRRLPESVTAREEALVLSSKISGATPSGDRQTVVDVLKDFALFLKRNNFKAQAKEFKEKAKEIDGYETDDSDSDSSSASGDDSDSDGDSASDGDGASDSDSDSDSDGGSDSDSGDEEEEDE